jgi:hypothetical protein
MRCLRSKDNGTVKIGDYTVIRRVFLVSIFVSFSLNSQPIVLKTCEEIPAKSTPSTDQEEDGVSYKIVKDTTLKDKPKIKYFAHRTNVFPFPEMKIGGLEIDQEKCQIEIEGKGRPYISHIAYKPASKIPKRVTLHWTLAGSLPSHSVPVDHINGISMTARFDEMAFPYLVLEPELKLYSGNAFDFIEIGPHRLSSDSILIMPKSEYFGHEQKFAKFDGTILPYSAKAMSSSVCMRKFLSKFDYPRVENVFAKINKETIHESERIKNNIITLLMQLIFKNNDNIGNKMYTLKLLGPDGNVSDDLLLLAKNDQDPKKYFLFPLDALSSIFNKEFIPKLNLEIIYRLPDNEFISKNNFHKWLNISLNEPDILTHTETEFSAIENYLLENDTNIDWKKMVKAHNFVKNKLTSITKKHSKDLVLQNKLEKFRSDLWTALVEIAKEK